MAPRWLPAGFFPRQITSQFRSLTHSHRIHPLFPRPPSLLLTKGERSDPLLSPSRNKEPFRPMKFVMPKISLVPLSFAL